MKLSAREQNALVGLMLVILISFLCKYLPRTVNKVVQELTFFKEEIVTMYKRKNYDDKPRIFAKPPEIGKDVIDRERIVVVFNNFKECQMISSGMGEDMDGYWEKN